MVVAKAAAHRVRQISMVETAALAAVVEILPAQVAPETRLAPHRLKEIMVEMAAAHRVLAAQAAVALLLQVQMAQGQLAVMVEMAPHHLFLGHP
jgi:hypothetical protein